MAGLGETTRRGGMRRGHGARALAFSAAFAIVFVLFGASAQMAWAQNDQNTINPSQMPDNSFLYDTSIYDLLQSNSSNEGKTVQVTGEVVGDLLTDSDDDTKAWITLSSTDSKKPGDISVLIDADDAGIIDSYGRYGLTGTIVRVKGTFHVTCPVHEATMDIHADTITAVQEGRAYTEQPNLDKFKWGIILCVAGVALSILYFILRERQR